MKIFGITLMALGIVALLRGGFGYNRQTTILEMGGIKATATEHKSLPIEPVFGVVALLGGTLLLLLPRMRQAQRA
jgi:hypothetical protein